MDSALARLRRESLVAALQTRSSLGFESNTPIDIFDAVRRTGLWLMFQPFDALFGLYQREARTAGMAINVLVHPSLQRFTAAHELGHHVLGHETGIDPNRHITRWAHLTTQEMAAQFFAAEFLMPIAAVNAVANHLGMKRADFADSDTVYQLSLRLGTSYSAMIVRLQTMQRINPSAARSLRAIQPAKIKERLLGHRLPDARSDAWALTPSDEESLIRPLVGDELRMALPEIPSSGRRWRALEIADSVRVEKDSLDTQDGEQSYGDSFTRVFHFAVGAPADTQIRLELVKPWNPAAREISLEIPLNSTPRPETGLDHHQQRLLMS